MKKIDLEILSEIIKNYSSENKEKREDSEKKLVNLRKKNMGQLCLGLLELSNQSNNNKIYLVLLRNIIEIDSKHYWGNIEQKIKEKIKQKSLDILLNNNEHFTKDNNKMIFVIEQLVHTIEDFNENWPELIEMTNKLLKLSFPKDINKIYAIIKTIKYCISFLSYELLLHLNNFNIFFKTIFDYNLNQNIKILETKVISCGFYSELFSYSLNNNLNDISSSVNFIFSYMIKTMNECINYLNNYNINESYKLFQINIEDLIFELLSHIEILIISDIFDYTSDLYNQLNIILNSIINLSPDKYKKIIEKSFQLLLDIYLKDLYSYDSKENIIKGYLETIFKYAYNNLGKSQNDFNLILNDYDDYELVPKINNEILMFVFDMTSQIIREDKKYINILQELENNLINSIDIKYKYISLLLLPQIIEARNNFSEVETYINICFNNINNESFEIRYSSFYSINYFISNFWNDFYLKYSFNFFQLIIQKIKEEANLHTKCEIISLFNLFISHLDDENETKEEIEKNVIVNNNKLINDTRQFFFNNKQEIFSFILNELYISKVNDSNKCLIKNELLKSLIISCQLLCDSNQPFFKDILSFLLEYLEDIFQNQIHSNLYINLLNSIICFGKYENNLIKQKLNLLFNCIKHIFQNISSFINHIANMNSIIENLLPLININNPEFISEMISTIIESMNILLNQLNENDLNHSDEIYNFLIIIDTSFEKIEEKCQNYLIQIETSIEKILCKLKNISKINNAISNILSSIIQIISKSVTNKVIKNKGKNYMEIIFNMIENEYNSSTSISLVDNLNKIFEIIVSNLTQNELEQIFNGIIKFIEFFENKIELFISKKNSLEKEIKIEEEMSISMDLNNEEDEEENDNKETIEKLDEDIENLEQVNENLSLIIENMLKYSSGKKLKNISEVIYNKIIPLLINSNNSSGNNIKVAVNLIDDIFEYLNFNKFSSYIIEDLINKLIQYSNFNKPEVRQATNYGLGIFIKLSEQNIYKLYFEKILKSLKSSCINYPNNNSQNEKKYRANGLAFENAIAAIGKAIEYKSMNVEEYIVFWLENLPLSFDETEMEEGHDILCNYIINNNLNKYNFEEGYKCKIIKILINVYKDDIKSNSTINDKIESILKSEYFKDILKNIYIESCNENNKIIINKIQNIIN